MFAKGTLWELVVDDAKSLAELKKLGIEFEKPHTWLYSFTVTANKKSPIMGADARKLEKEMTKEEFVKFAQYHHGASTFELKKDDSLNESSDSNLNAVAQRQYKQNFEDLEPADKAVVYMETVLEENLADEVMEYVFNSLLSEKEQRLFDKLKDQYTIEETLLMHLDNLSPTKAVKFATTVWQYFEAKED